MFAFALPVACRAKARKVRKERAKATNAPRAIHMGEWPRRSPKQMASYATIAANMGTFAPIAPSLPERSQRSGLHI